jgi:predicted TIM-barrel fold metal-dependent hydrolase
MPFAIEVLGDDGLMYASDYPPWDCAYPDSVRQLRERTDLSEASKRQLLGENAARLYGLNGGCA